MNEVLTAAIRYAEHGWRVFPCKARAKEPATRHGLKDATTDVSALQRHWLAFPEDNVAIATGEPGPDVLDVDSKPGGNGWDGFARLKQAGLLAGAFAVIRTRSGGLHLYFAGTGQRNAAHIGGFDLDYRGAGGYVVAPPSYVAGDGKGPAGFYELIESRSYTGALFDLAAARLVLDPPKERPPARAGSTGTATGWFRMDRMAAYVASLPEGMRNAQLFWACCRAVEAGVSDLTELVAAAVSAGLPEAEAWRTAMSAERQAGS